MGVKLQISGVEAQNSIGGERYYYPLRRIFEVTKSEHNKLVDKIILRMYIKAINGTMGPNGIVPSLLVSGPIPKFPYQSNMNPKQTERFEAVKLARPEMETIVA